MANPAETMRIEAQTNPILKRYRAALNEIYGAQIDRVILYGSRARGDARPDSDYDIAIFLKSLPDRWKVFHQLAKLQCDFIDETSAFFDTKPFEAAFRCVTKEDARFTPDIALFCLTPTPLNPSRII